MQRVKKGAALGERERTKKNTAGEEIGFIREKRKKKGKKETWLRKEN
jgi:hypothetical protein